MPYKKLNHDSSRLKVCCLCFRKATRKLTPKHEVFVKKLILDYDKTDPAFPTGICSSCRIILDTRASKDVVIALEHKAKIGFYLRSDKICKCRICHIAKAKGLEAKAMKKKAGRHCKSKKAAVKVCSYCFIKLSRGTRHPLNKCRSKKSKISNFEAIFLHENKFCEQITSRALKRKYADCKKAEFNLSTVGRPRKVSLNTKTTNDIPSLTSQELITIKSNLNLSDKNSYTSFAI